jgi:hypothetical protein
MILLKTIIKASLPDNPAPLPKPEISPYFDKMGHAERVSEVIRYSILSTEYSISPQGGLRYCLKWFIFLGILILFGMFLMAGLNEMMELFCAAAKALFEGVLYILKTILLGIVIFAIGAIIYFMVKFSGGGSGDDKNDKFKNAGFTRTRIDPKTDYFSRK